MRRNSSALALVALVVLSAVVGTAGAATIAASPGNSAVNYDAEQAPNPYIAEEHVTIAEHNRSAMDSVLQYYDDNGDVQTLPASVNESIDNPVGIVPTEIDDPMFGEYPRKGASDGASILDASEWTAESDMSVAEANGAPAEGVPAVRVSTNGSFTSSSTGAATYANQSITSDASKRVPTVFADVDSLEAGAHVELRFVDADGDFKAASINASEDASTASVIANATGEGYVWQERLADLATEGSGDGSFDAIEEIAVNVTGGDADVLFTAVDAEHKSEVVLGERLEDTDDDDELETVTVRERHEAGALRLSGLDTLGGTFDDAALQNVDVYGLQYEAQYVPSEDAATNYSSADDYPGYDSILTYDFRLSVPSAIDLTHHGLSLEAEQSFLENRYNTYHYVEGAGDTEVADIDSWTDVSDKLGEQGSTIVIDDTVQADTNYVVEGSPKLQSDQVDALQDTGGGGVVGAPAGSSGGLLGGLLNSPFAIFGSLVAAIVGIPKAIGKYVNR